MGEKRGMGRRSKFTPAIAQTIIDRLSEGTPLTVICRDIGVDRSVVHDWKDVHEDFSRRFARAKDLGYDAIGEQTLEIADDGTNDYVETDDGRAFNAEHVQRSKLRVETRLKLLAKWDPKRYGEKQQVAVSGELAVEQTTRHVIDPRMLDDDQRDVLRGIIQSRLEISGDDKKNG